MDTNWLTKQGWMEVAVNFGLIVPTDYSDRMFHPSKAITRYEIAVMVDRAMGKVYPANYLSTEELPFTDTDQIPEWVQGYVSEAVKAGVLTGYPDGTFGHKKSATRAEAVAMVQRMLDYTNEGADPDLKLTIKYRPRMWSSDEPAQATTDKVRMQIVDDILYASIYDITTVQTQLMSDNYYGMFWHPIWQQLCISMEGDKFYRAGTNLYGRSSTYGEIISFGQTFPTATRMLDGKIMIPIYDFNSECFEDHGELKGYWDKETNTIALPVDYVDSYHAA